MNDIDPVLPSNDNSPTCGELSNKRGWAPCDRNPGHTGPHTWPLIPPPLAGLSNNEPTDDLAEQVERAVFDAWAVREGDEPTADVSWWHIHRSGPTHTKWAADAALGVVRARLEAVTTELAEARQEIAGAFTAGLAQIERRCIAAEAERDELLAAKRNDLRPSVQSWNTIVEQKTRAEAESQRLRAILDDADQFVEWGVEYGAGVNVYDEQADAEEWSQWLVQPNQVVRRDVYRTPWAAAVLGGNPNG